MAGASDETRKEDDGGAKLSENRRRITPALSPDQWESVHVMGIDDGGGLLCSHAWEWYVQVCQQVGVEL